MLKKAILFSLFSVICVYANDELHDTIMTLMSKMTLEEKVSLCHGNTNFTTAGIERLNIPPLRMSDGPHGVREEISLNSWAPAGWTNDYATYFPTGTALAATWNPQLANEFGKALGAEARYRNKDILLGPALNIIRTPLCGRNFEYFSEDPFLVSKLVVPLITGIQTNDVAACAKHFVANNQEKQRGSINVKVDERTLQEIYLPGFKAAVTEGNVLSVMGAYNKVRGQHCCHNDYLLNTVLKGDWGFKGVVISDWGGTHDTYEAALNGLDIEMGTDLKDFDSFYLADPFLKALKNGDIDEKVLDEKVYRILYVRFHTNMKKDRKQGEFNTPKHQQLTKKMAHEAVVLLKNENNLLPLDSTQIKSIAVIGENAVREHAYGGGSSSIKALYEVTPLEGLINAVGMDMDLNFSAGYSSEETTDDMINRAAETAEQADVAIVFGGLNHNVGNDSEMADRTSMKLPYRQDELIQKIVKANPKTIVVNISGSPVNMQQWIEDVPGVLQGWYAGMEAGNAFADILFGAVNPSGKLAFTFPKKLSDSPAHTMGNYPGKDGVVHYEEGVLVGYRYFDTKEIEPQFCFGHGLSYTNFDYQNLTISSQKDDKAAVVECNVTNTGKVKGAEIVQVYVGDEKSTLYRPVQELKGFQKVNLEPGETKKVTVTLDGSAFAYFNLENNQCIAEKGRFTIRVGSSSRDIRLQDSFELEKTIVIE